MAVTATVLVMYAHRQVIKRRCVPPFKSSALKLLLKCHSDPIELEERFILATTKKRSIKLNGAMVRNSQHIAEALSLRKLILCSLSIYYTVSYACLRIDR
jgi:hypothetical protein